jgi:hypothetical protein
MTEEKLWNLRLWNVLFIFPARARPDLQRRNKRGGDLVSHVALLMVTTQEIIMSN